MKNFLKYLTASCLGTILAIAVIILVLMVVGMSSAPDSSISSGSTLHIKLDTEVPELTDNVVSSGYSFPPVALDRTGLNDITKAIINAAKDSKIKALLIETEFPSIGQSTTLSIYNAIDSFKTSGKPVIAYGEYFSQSGYLLASVADTVVLNPNGQLGIRGFGMLIPYMADLLKNIDAKVDVYFAGQYKSAIEPYYRSESSPQNDLQAREFLTDWQDEWLKNVTHYRKSDKEQILSIINEGKLVTAEVALETGLVDKLMYWEDLEKALKSITGRKLKLVELNEYVKGTSFSSSSSSTNRIAIVYFEGDILKNGGKGTISMDRYEKVFDRIAKNDKVKAVVLRVNSGGGDAVVSDIIWDRVEELKSKGKYVVASFGDYAASGGYYISCSADKIVTQPNTLTGSIGVFAMLPDFSNTLSNKLGINFDTIGTGRNTFIYSSLVSRSKAQNEKIQAETEQTYDLFIRRVAEGRNMSVDEVDEVAQGRVWSGEDAVDAGLADEIGDLKEAIALAAEGAEIDDYKLLQYPLIKKSMYEQLLYEIMTTETVQAVIGPKKKVKYKKEFSAMMELFSDERIGRPQYRLPFLILQE